MNVAVAHMTRWRHKVASLHLSVSVSTPNSPNDYEVEIQSVCASGRSANYRTYKESFVCVSLSRTGGSRLLHSATRKVFTIYR